MANEQKQWTNEAEARLMKETSNNERQNDIYNIHNNKKPLQCYTA